jgi:hypothetical protein
MLKIILQFLAVVSLYAAPLLQAQLIGDPAPPLAVIRWFKGPPVEIKPGTNLYVVEFWTTADTNSHAATGILNEIQKRFGARGVAVAAVTDDKPEKITDFMGSGGRDISFAVAGDDGRKTISTYFKPIGHVGIPYAFIVGTNGNVWWHGPPQAGLTESLDAIMSGRYDLARMQKMDLVHHQMAQYLQLAHQGSDRVNSAGRNLLAACTNDATLLCDLAIRIAIAPKLAIRDFALAREALNQAGNLDKTNFTEVTFCRGLVAFESGKTEEGLALGRQALASAQSPAEKKGIQAWITAVQARSSSTNSAESNSSHTVGASTNQTDSAHGSEGRGGAGAVPGT